MSTNNEQVLELYSNPALVQSRALADLQARLSNETPIVDGNNVCSFLLENFAANSSDIVRSMINEMDPLYALRAQTAEDLYRHMSDFDYLNLFSTPATTYITLTFRKDTIVKSAVNFNTAYNKLVIPKNSVFTIEQFVFGIYYPIEIRVNKNTETLVVVHDTSIDNPLHTLVQNTIEHREYTSNGVELVTLMIPVHQFARSTTIEELSQSSVFVKTISYTDKFYAVRAYTNNGTDSAFVEVSQTLSDEVYDPDVATVRFTVDTENKTIKLAIPQVYMTSGMFGSRLKIDVLTTKGAIDANVSNIPPEQITTKFTLTGNTEDDKYIKPLTKPDLIFTRLASDKIVGGGDGISFEELRDRVVHNSFYGSVILSPVDVINYLADRGFAAKKYQDGITNRIYICEKELRTDKNVIIPAANLPTEFTNDILNGTATININNDGSYTVYPTTIYKYDKEAGKSIPLSDAEVASLAALSNNDLVEELNSNTYTSFPYHLRVDTNHRYPSAYAYDFNNPLVKNIEFIGENVTVATQMTCAQMKITHAKAGIGGFDIELYVVKSDDLTDVSNSDLKVVLSIASDSGKVIYQEATYDREEVGMSVFVINVGTDYAITASQKIKITSMLTQTSPVAQYINLSTDVDISFFVSNSVLTSSGPTNIALELASIFSTYIPVAQQQASVVFGELRDELFTNVDILYSELEYETYDEDEILHYSSDVYERDVDGKIVYSIGGGGEVVLSIEHAEGDIVYTRETIFLSEDVIEDYYGATVVIDTVILDESNRATYLDTLQELDIPVYIHKTGDIKVDNYGNPIVSKDREINYHVNLLQVDRKLSYSTKPEHAEFYDNLLDKLDSNQDVIQDLKPQLIEETWAYYTPLRSIGKADFQLDNLSKVTIDLELSMRLKLYVQKHVINNRKIIKALRSSVISIVDSSINTGVISMVAIAERIKEESGGLISSIDVLGINDQTGLQTMISAGENVIPSLKTVLLLDDAGNITTGRDLDIEFVEMNI